MGAAGGATAHTRRELLERLVPRLAIADRATVSGRFLEVRGTLRTYRIHLGSGNILMSPNDQYLCIVPNQAPNPAGPVFLPFDRPDDPPTDPLIAGTRSAGSPYRSSVMWHRSVMEVR